jgi:hypothetical protein
MSLIHEPLTRLTCGKSLASRSAYSHINRILFVTKLTEHLSVCNRRCDQCDSTSCEGKSQMDLSWGVSLKSYTS